MKLLVVVVMLLGQKLAAFAASCFLLVCSGEVCFQKRGNASCIIIVEEFLLLHLLFLPTSDIKVARLESKLHPVGYDKVSSSLFLGKTPSGKVLF